MSKTVLSLACAGLVFGLVVVAREHDLGGWWVAAGFAAGWILAAGLWLIRNRFFIFLFALGVLVLSYFAWECRLAALAAGSLAGAMVATLMVLGWVRPHIQFRLSEYRAHGPERS